MNKYAVKSTKMANDPQIKVGDIVYDTKYHDYGLAGDDTRHTGIEHISVTFKENGDYPFFTIPKANLEKVE